MSSVLSPHAGLDDCSEVIDEIVDALREIASEGDPDGVNDFIDNVIERLTLVKARVNA